MENSEAVCSLRYARAPPSTHFFSVTRSFKSNHSKNTMTLQLKVPEMTCGGCVSTITKAVKTVDANAVVQGDPKTKTVLVETQAPETAIRAALAKVGYPTS